MAQRPGAVSQAQRDLRIAKTKSYHFPDKHPGSSHQDRLGPSRQDQKNQHNISSQFEPKTLCETTKSLFPLILDKVQQEKE
jgi:hypothetical protein